MITNGDLLEKLNDTLKKSHLELSTEEKQQAESLVRSVPQEFSSDFLKQIEGLPEKVKKENKVCNLVGDITIIAEIIGALAMWFLHIFSSHWSYLLPGVIVVAICLHIIMKKNRANIENVFSNLLKIIKDFKKHKISLLKDKLKSLGYETVSEEEVQSYIDGSIDVANEVNPKKRKKKIPVFLIFFIIVVFIVFANYAPI